jgi:Ca-activated chloride channel family protein
MGFRKNRLLALAVAAGTAVTLSAAGQQRPTYRSIVRTVPVYVTVTDSEGRLVPGLTKDDFQVFDNKRPQPLTAFSNAVLPITAVVLLDTSGSMTNYIDFVKQACEQFLLRLLPKDRVSLGYFNDTVKLVSPLVGDRDELISRVRADIDYGNATHLYDAIDLGVNTLHDIDGRRVIVVFTDGEDEGSKLHLNPVIDHVLNEGDMVYGIGLHTRYFNGVRWEEGIPARVLKKIAEDTGGGFFELKKTDDLNSTFTKVEQELHSQYVLGFTPPELDGKTHAIEVTVKKPGMKARSRRSYVATPETLTEKKQASSR